MGDVGGELAFAVEGVLESREQVVESVFDGDHFSWQWVCGDSGGEVVFGDGGDIGGKELEQAESVSDDERSDEERQRDNSDAGDYEQFADGSQLEVKLRHIAGYDECDHLVLSFLRVGRLRGQGIVRAELQADGPACSAACQLQGFEKRLVRNTVKTHKIVHAQRRRAEQYGAVFGPELVVRGVVGFFELRYDFVAEADGDFIVAEIIFCGCGERLCSRGKRLVELVDKGSANESVDHAAENEQQKQHSDDHAEKQTVAE